MEDINSIVRFQGGSGTAPASDKSSAAPNAASAEAPAAANTPKGEVAAPPAAGNEKTSETQQEAKAGDAKAGEEKPTQARDESGKFAKAAETPPAEKPKSGDQTGAIIAMRQRLQAAENRVRELEGSGKAAPPSVLEDEDRAFNTRIDQGTRGLREQNFRMSMKLARLTHGETFAQAEQAFAEAAEQDERLIAGLRASDDPGDYIYTVGLQIKELASVGGDFVKYREKIAAESQAQLTERDNRIKALEAEVASLKQSQTAREEVPASLNRQPSGAVPAREGDSMDVNKIVRFKSG